MKKVLSGFVRAASKIIGKKNFERLLIYSAKTMDINLHEHALIQIGGSDPLIENGSGEHKFIEETLSCLCSDIAQPVFFDVGANVGNYSLALRKYFKTAVIHSFEPITSTFQILQNNTMGFNININNIGFSNVEGTGVLYNTIGNADTEIASAYKEVFTEVFKQTHEVVPIEFRMETIDNFCASNNINNIDFLKIDVEGHELSVLQGAEKMLKNKKIRFIQFEFNSHNVYSRVFLRDFYILLDGFEFYRITQKGTVKLGPYNTANEIFVQQNILAANQNISHCVDDASVNGPAQ